MKSKNRKRVRTLFFLSFLSISSILVTNSFYYSKLKSDANNFINIKSSAFPAQAGNIYIDNNWTDAKVVGICSGNGTETEPYIIEDLSLKGDGYYWSCIVIKNSNAYFKIENCTLYTTGYGLSYAINMYNVQNGLIIENNCSTSRSAICLFYCTNINISKNIIREVKYIEGIYLEHSDGNVILNNRIYDCERNAIYLTSSRNNKISGNELYGCGLELTGSVVDLWSQDIDSTNKVNEKPLYYYYNKTNLTLNNFTNAGQVILINCSQSLISQLNVVNGSIGISLYYCNNNTISENNASYNKVSGIYLVNSNFNFIYKNIVNFTFNSYEHDYNGISLKWSNYNNITDNTASNDYSGIYLFHSESNLISKNRLENNLEGIYLTSSNENYILGNNASYNYAGIDLRDCNLNQIEQNIVINVSFSGIYLSRGNNNNIKANYIINSRLGIELFYSNYDIISENIVCYSSYAGIMIWHKSSYNVISENNLYNSSNYGIYLRDDSNHNQISKNILIGNRICIFEENCLWNHFWDNGMCLYAGKRPVDILLYVGLGVFIITVLVLLEKKRRKTHKF